MSGREPKPILTDDEREDYDLSENADWLAIGNIDEDRSALQAAARTAVQDIQDQRIELVLSRKDLETLKSRAAEQGMHYRALIESILRNYADG
ncbi:DNA-binding protein [Jiella mangrovi]|uniref:DNA-binding protein n=1 Tax=Jiella mangrovi TaxID=2821407 RepID=A0ABS4BHH6_9HYPH|nr:DNA-binding protein [Jiella mangrovi]MBP0616203.1 DNA-binding protein [Jiella mangrovi]